MGVISTCGTSIPTASSERSEVPGVTAAEPAGGGSGAGTGSAAPEDPGACGTGRDVSPLPVPEP